MRIGEVAKRANIPASTLRYYEDIGLIPAPARVSGQRWYDDSVFDVLKRIQLAQKAGFSLDEIRSLFDSDTTEQSAGVRWRSLARDKLQAVKKTIQQQQATLQVLQDGLECACTDLDACDLIA